MSAPQSGCDCIQEVVIYKSFKCKALTGKNLVFWVVGSLMLGGRTWRFDCIKLFIVISFRTLLQQMPVTLSSLLFCSWVTRKCYFLFSIRKHLRSHLWEIITSLANNDCNVNKNGKNAIGLGKQNNNSACASCFFVHFFAVTTRLEHKMPDFMFCGECEHKTTTFIIQWNRTSAIKFEEAQLHFLNDVFVAIAVVVA